MKASMKIREQTILVISDDATFCSSVRRALESKEARLRVAAVSSVDAAQRIIENAAPAVILLEETVVTADVGGTPHHPPRLDLVTSALANHAPVVVIGAPDRQRDLTALIAAGSANFVCRAAGCLPAALAVVEQRLQQASSGAPASQRRMSHGDSRDGEAFGELLRHELNNPLTGILGNAELLLAEVRRKNDGRLPNGGQERLETIAALAVRLRETVRRLSEDWETRHHPAH